MWSGLSKRIKTGFSVTGGVAALALGAQLAWVAPFSPVPITGQTLAALWVGALLGPKRGIFSGALYLIAGAVGLPVFASGKAGLEVLLGPTGGYLFGLVLVTLVAGLAVGDEKHSCHRGGARFVFRLFGAFVFAQGLVFLVGLPWLARFRPEWVLRELLQKGFLIFIPGLLMKALLGAVGVWLIQVIRFSFARSGPRC